MSVTALQQLQQHYTSEGIRMAKKAITIVREYNVNAIVSMMLAALFILYFFIPHNGVFSSILGLSVLFILFLPLAVLILSIISLRQISLRHEKGGVLSYFALGITTLYFMTALAIPVVLVGLYLVYSFVL